MSSQSLFVIQQKSPNVLGCFFVKTCCPPQEWKTCGYIKNLRAGTLTVTVQFIWITDNIDWSHVEFVVGYWNHTRVVLFSGTMGKRLSQINVENNEDHRRQYRQLLFTTEPEKLKEHISGVILFHETFYQKVRTLVNITLKHTRG